MFDLIPTNRKAPPSASMESLASQNQNRVLILGKQRLCNMFEAGLLHSSIPVTSFATLQIKDIKASLLWLSDFVDNQGHRKWMPVTVQNQAIHEHLQAIYTLQTLPCWCNQHFEQNEPSPQIEQLQREHKQWQPYVVLEIIRPSETIGLQVKHFHSVCFCHLPSGRMNNQVGLLCGRLC